MLNVRKPVVASKENTTKDTVDNHARQVDQMVAADFLHRLQKGDEQAWNQLVTEWTPRLYGFVRSQVPSDQDAEDILGETFAALVKSIRTFDGKAALSTFIYSIAKRKIADHWRKRKPTDELPENIETAGPTSQALILQEALAKLPEQSREALLLKYQMGLSVSEIAEIIKRSYKATESLLSRARSQLQAALNGDD